MKVLFGVSDWGLGHATRDIPIIEEILKRRYKVDIISTGRALELLKRYFGKKLRYFDIPGVYTPYTRTNYMALKFAVSIPKMATSIKRIRKESKKIIEKEKYDIIINDSRPDVFDRKENSFFISHQLRYKFPLFTQIIIDVTFLKIMKYYSKIIVPDFPGGILSGMLSHNPLFSGKVVFIGTLSHVQKKNVKEDIDYFISISGPEPQRTVFEEKILSQIKDLKGKVVIALGKPESCHLSSNKKVLICGFFDSKKQEDIMNRAKVVISRSGYTTVMDLIALGKKKVIFVPTPGQSEQEYLGDMYNKRNYFHHVHQNKISLKDDVLMLNKCKGFKAPWSTKQTVKNFMKEVFGK